MKTNKEPKWYSDIDSFYKLPSFVTPIVEVINKDGVVTSLSAPDKLVYSYMLSRIRYFCWERGGDYYEKQEDIAYELGIGVQVVQRAIFKLMDCGILIGEKVRYMGRWKWIFTDMKDIRSCAIQPVKKEGGVTSGVIKNTAKDKQNNQTQGDSNGEDDNTLPF